MGTDTPQPQQTKAWLTKRGLRAITKKSRRNVARTLLLDGGALPGTWLSKRQRAFLALPADAAVRGRTRTEADELLRRIVHLCDVLVPQLIEDHVAPRHVDRASKALHRRVLFALLQNCESWPSAGTQGLEHLVRAAMGEHLGWTPAGPDPVVVRSDRHPVDQLDLADRIITQAGDSPVRHRLANQLLWDQEKRYALRIVVLVGAAVALGALHLAMFLILRSVAPDLLPKEAALVVGSAIAAIVSGTGIGLLGPALRARWSPGRSAIEPPPAARSDGEDPVRPTSR